MSTRLLHTSVLSCSFPINAPLKSPFSPNRLWVFGQTVKWEDSLASCFVNQTKDVVEFDSQTNGPWPEFETAM
jgi:hypothetical protein